MSSRPASSAVSLWSVEKEFRSKVFFLTATFFLLTGCQAIWRPLKASIFSKIVGAEFTPDAKLYTLVLLIPLVIFYSYLVDILRRHQLLYCFTLFHAVGGLIFSVLLAHPVYGIANTAQHPSRLVGWAFYLMMESFSAFLSATFWSFANSVNKPKDARKFYGIFVSGSKVGGVFAAGTLYLSITCSSLADSVLLPAYLLIGSIMLFCASGCIYLLMKRVPGYYMHGYEAVYQVEKKRKEKEEGKVSLWERFKRSFSGLSIVINNSYVLGIFSLVLFYDIMSSIFDYRVLRMADAANPTAGGLAAYYALYYLCMHASGFFISLFGTMPIQRLIGVRASLFIFPLLSIVLILSAYFLPYAKVLFVVLVLLRALNYAFNHPTREVLYIPTTKDIKFKAKAWTDAFGSRIAKGTGSLFNKAANSLSSNMAILASTGINTGLALIWLTVVYFLGKRFQEATSRKQVIGNNGLQDEEPE